MDLVFTRIIQPKSHPRQHIIQILYPNGHPGQSFSEPHAVQRDRSLQCTPTPNRIHHLSSMKGSNFPFPWNIIGLICLSGCDCALLFGVFVIGQVKERLFRWLSNRVVLEWKRWHARFRWRTVRVFFSEGIQLQFDGSWPCLFFADGTYNNYSKNNSACQAALSPSGGPSCYWLFPLEHGG